jgi:hypothetical protein
LPVLRLQRPVERQVIRNVSKGLGEQTGKEGISDAESGPPYDGADRPAPRSLVSRRISLTIRGCRKVGRVMAMSRLKPEKLNGRMTMLSENVVLAATKRSDQSGCPSERYV